MRNLFRPFISLSDLASSALILLLLSFVFHLTLVLDRVDFWIFDIGQRVMTTPAPNDVVIVAVDQNSLSEIGRWPWTRNIHAQLIQRISAESPAVIGFDVIFAESEQGNPAADVALAAAMATSQRVVLPVLIEATRANGQVVETLPLPMLAEHAADLGRVHAVLDRDGIARSVYLFEGVGLPYWQLFAQAVLNVSQQQPTKNQSTHSANQPTQHQFTLTRALQRQINFTGPPGHFARISYAQVLNGEYPQGLFHNKVVLVGATALGMNDWLTTPVSFSGQPMAGVEFHANVFTALRAHTLIQTVPFWLSTVLIMCCAVMPLIWLPKQIPLIGFVTTLMFLMLIALMASLLPKLFNIWVPPAAGLAALILAYPIWSWRKLEAAHAYLDDELHYLQQHLLNLPTQPQLTPMEGYDTFDTRIAQVRNASEQLRFLQNNREETLAFISHDIRAPLAAALMVIEQSPPEAAKLHASLSRALDLAEDFLQTSRAEMMNNHQFNEIDLVGLVHQAIDDGYETAQRKNITLHRNLVDGVAWVNGNFGLLHRAIYNLISNAIKYSPSNTEVIITLKVNLVQQVVMLSVTDQGPGIEQSVQADVFKRFSRLKMHESSNDGTGLGLYFVKTVIEKHLGSIALESVADSGATFRLQLPMIGFQTHQD
ncbi:MAG: CHASE2 domain-containing protein [Methylophilus sp.]|nr:CHASE2 domain-containing protein [Methylophilus sp.]